MGQTTVRLPFGGCASTDPGQVRQPRVVIGLWLLLLFLFVATLVWSYGAEPGSAGTYDLTNPIKPENF